MTIKQKLLRWEYVLMAAGLAAAAWMTWRVIPDYGFDGRPAPLWAWAAAIWGVSFHAIGILMLCLTPAIVLDEVRRNLRD